VLRPGMTPGFKSPEHRAAFIATRTDYWRAGGPPRCTANNKEGRRCGSWALSGQPWCFRHAPKQVRRERRQRLLCRPATPEQLARRHARVRAQQLRHAWRKDRWQPGSTIVLGERELAFRADLEAAGLDFRRMSPCTRDGGNPHLPRC
jgi:hypothetical protein